MRKLPLPFELVGKKINNRLVLLVFYKKQVRKRFPRGVELPYCTVRCLSCGETKDLEVHDALRRRCKSCPQIKRFSGISNEEARRILNSEA